MSAFFQTWGSLIGYGGMGVFAFAPFHWVPFYGISIGMFAQFLKKATTPSQVCIGSFVYTYTYFLAGLYWVVYALGVDWNKYWVIAPLVLLGLPLLFVGWYILAAYVWWKYLRSYKWSWILFVVLWMGAELMRAYAFTGFPWNMPANIWTFSPFVLQLCSWVGAYGLSLLTIGAGVGGVALWAKLCHPWHQKLYLSLVAVGMGLSLWDPFIPTPMTDLRIHVVQPNIAQVHKMDSQRAGYILRTLKNLSEPSIQEGHCIVWPEGALPFAIRLSALPEGLLEYFQSITRNRHSLLATGIRWEQKPHKILNSVFWVGPDGTIRQTVDKVHLLPFGEFMPFRSFLPQLLVDLAVGPEDITPGTPQEAVYFKNGYVLKPLNCFESLFANLIPEDLHPDALIVVTNDAWFGWSTGPYQHLSSAILRAAEFGVPVIRAANTGISAVIDPKGRVLHQLSLNTEGTISTFLPKKEKQTTFYHQHRWFGFGVILLLLLGLWINRSGWMPGMSIKHK